MARLRSGTTPALDTGARSGRSVQEGPRGFISGAPHHARRTALVLPVLPVLLGLILPVLVLGPGHLGPTAVVVVPLIATSLMGARGTTDSYPQVVATHLGLSVATSTEAGPATATITPSATDATTAVRAATVTAGD